MKHLPKSLKIGPSTYKIITTRLNKIGHGKLWGLTNFVTQEISIEEGITPARRAMVLLHEIIEVVNELNEIG